MSKIKTEVFRIPLPAPTIEAMLSYLSLCSQKFEMPALVDDIYKKLEVHQFKVSRGLKLPDYVHVGRASAAENLVARLGLDPQELWYASLDKEQKDAIDLEYYDWQFSTGNEGKSKEQYIKEVFQTVQSDRDTPAKSGQSGQSDPDEFDPSKFIEPGSNDQDKDLGDLLGKL